MGPHWFPSPNVAGKDLLRLMEDLGYIRLDLRIRHVGDRTNQGYDSVIFAMGMKPGATL